MNFIRRSKVGIWALLMTGCLAALLALPLAASANPATAAAPPPRPLSDAPWGDDVMVPNDGGTADQDDPSIAVDPNGNAYAVWDDRRNGILDIYFSYRPAQGAWGGHVKVNDDVGTATQGNPAIAVDPRGNAYAVWEDERNGNYDIFFSYRPAGGSWGGNVKVSDDVGTAHQGNPAIAVDPRGNAYAVWEDERNDSGDIYFSYRPAGGAWGGNVKVSDDGTNEEQENTDIAVDPSGNAYAAWEDKRNGNDDDIFFSYRPAGGAWGGNVKVSDDVGTAYQYYPSITVDPSGNAYAVWRDDRNGNKDIYSSYRPAGGAWGGNVRVDDDGTNEDQEHPDIAVDPCGNAYAVWEDERSRNDDIFFSYRPAGGPWGTNGRVDDHGGTAPQMRPSIAVDPSGNAYAAWADERNENRDIYFSYLPSQVFLSLGDLVWQDADQNGLQDAGEAGVQGVVATLYQNGVCTAPALATDTTDANGNYLFTAPSGCTYCVAFSNIPAGWNITLQNQGGDDTVDSDADPATAQIRNIVLTADDLDEDVGLYVVAVAAEEEFVPELGTLALLGSGLAGLAGYATLRLRLRL